jgi:hypothetical protein
MCISGTSGHYLLAVMSYYRGRRRRKSGGCNACVCVRVISISWFRNFSRDLSGNVVCVCLGGAVSSATCVTTQGSSREVNNKNSCY